MFTRSTPAVLLAVLFLIPIKLFAQEQTNSDPADTSDKSGAVEEPASTDQPVADPPVKKSPIERFWERALANAVRQLHSDDTIVRAQLEVALKQSKMRRDNYQRAFAEQKWRDEKRIANPFAPSRSSSERSGDYAIMSMLEEEVIDLEEKLEALKAEQIRKATPLAWSKLSEADRAAIIDAKVLTTKEKITLGIKDNVTIPSNSHLVNSIGMNLIEIPTGGYLATLSDRNSTREIVVNKAFWMSETEVTQGQFYQIITNKTEAQTSPDDEPRIVDPNPELPVTVTWYDAVRFCMALSELSTERSERRYYRLPTEAEWEHACRAGTNNYFHFGNADTVPPMLANHFGNFHRASSGPKPVRSYQASPFGLYDMHGNVAEWCGDWYDKEYFDTCPREDPPGPDEQVFVPCKKNSEYVYAPTRNGKVYRGGSYLSDYGSAAASTRFEATGGEQGFRVVCEFGEASKIALKQYKDLEDHDSKVMSPRYKRILIESIAALKERWDELNAESVSGEEEWLTNIRKSDERHDYACRIYSALAEVYRRLERPEMVEKAMKEAIKHRLAYIEALELNLYREQDMFITQFEKLAQLYIATKDYDKAEPIADFILERIPKQKNMVRIKEQIQRERAQK